MLGETTGCHLMGRLAARAVGARKAARKAMYRSFFVSIMGADRLHERAQDNLPAFSRMRLTRVYEPWLFFVGRKPRRSSGGPSCHPPNLDEVTSILEKGNLPHNPGERQQKVQIKTHRTGYGTEPPSGFFPHRFAQCLSLRFRHMTCPGAFLRTPPALRARL